MAFTQSDGRLVAIHRPSYTAPTSVRLTPDYTADYAEVYAKQSQVRVVVDFLARNVSQLSLQTFSRVGDADRRRLTDHPLALLLRKPNPFTTGTRLIRDTIADRGIYDRALWVKSYRDGAAVLYRIPPKLWGIDPKDTNWLTPSHFLVKGANGEFEVPADQAVYFRGFNPEDPRVGLSPIESLRRALSEEWAASQMREQVLRNGARHSGYISRPADAPKWDDTGRARFKAGWRGQYQGFTATEAGGTPVLEDGMTFVPASQSAADLQYVESRKLTREEVAAAYFIPPPMVGILDHATFSNITEQHKMLYQDTLGPILAEFVDELWLQLLPEFGDTDLYVEFNMLEKLRGSFEEQVSQIQAAVGAPWLTRDEARARFNLSPVEGGDQLVVPLNVLVGGQASPSDVDSQSPAVRAAGGRTRPRVKARPEVPWVQKIEGELRTFFKRQGAAVLSKLGAKADGWWSEDRWDGELTVLLYKLSVALSPMVAEKALAGLGEDGEYDVDRTLAYLQEVASNDARSMNAATKAALDEALAGDEPEAAAAAVFERAEGSRAAAAALGLAAGIAGFATVEAAQQVAGVRKASKTWIVTSSNPRAEHAAMDGETVPVDGVFSNGAKWPGDGVLGADGTAGCMCDVEIGFEEV